MYLFLWVANSTSSSSLLLLDFFLETLDILSAILLPIKSPVASTVFWILLLEVVFTVSAADFLAASTIFFHIYYSYF